jgi:hypothetical protein
MLSKQFRLSPLAVEPENAALMLDTSPRVVELLAEAGELDTVSVGIGKHILVASIEAYLYRQLSPKAIWRLADHAERIGPRPWWARADEARPAEVAPAG